MRAKGFDKIVRHLVAVVAAVSIQGLLVAFLVSMNHHKKPIKPPPPKRIQRILTLRTRPKPPPRKTLRQVKTLRPRNTPSLLPALKLASPVALPNVQDTKNAGPLGLLHPGGSGAGGTGGTGWRKNIILTEDLVDVPPKVLARIPPKYPAHAEIQQVQGYVDVRILVSAKGNVERVLILQSQPPGVFNVAATQAILKWRFKPAVFQGRATRVWARQRLNFKLED